MEKKIVDAAEYRRLLCLLRRKIDFEDEDLKVFYEGDAKLVMMSEGDNVYIYSSGERGILWLNCSTIISPI